MKNVENRLRALEKSAVHQAAAKLVFVATTRPDGTRTPLGPGFELAPRYAVLPEVCKTTSEWLKRYAPRPDARAKQ